MSLYSDGAGEEGGGTDLNGTIGIFKKKKKSTLSFYRIFLFFTPLVCTIKKFWKQWFRLCIWLKENKLWHSKTINVLYPLSSPVWFVDTPLWTLNCLGIPVPSVWGFMKMILHMKHRGWGATLHSMEKVTINVMKSNWKTSIIWINHTFVSQLCKWD